VKETLTAHGPSPLDVSLETVLLVLQEHFGSLAAEMTGIIVGLSGFAENMMREVQDAMSE
jgi:hypothetical protein